MKSIILYLCLILSPGVCFAEDIYIAQNSAGAANGTSCGNAYAVPWFNTSGNWANPKQAGKIGPGDTAHLCGTITSQLTILASGTSGNVITIFFETNAKMSSPAWPSDGAISASRKSYIVIDGGSNGIIENTANGTNLANQVDSIGVWLETPNYTTVQNLAINNLYVRPIGTDPEAYGTGVKILNSGGNTTGYGNNRVTNCSGHDMARFIHLSYYGDCRNYEFDHLTAYNINWGGAAGAKNSGNDHLTNISVHDNYFHDFVNWDDTLSNNHHHNGWFTWAVTPGSTVTTIRYYNNKIGPNYGDHATSGLFVQGHIDDVMAYNNIFVANSNDNPMNGFIFFDPDASQSGTYRIYNNTVIGGGTGIAFNIRGSGSGGETKSAYVYNNIINNVNTGIAIYSNADVVLFADYNDYYPSPKLSTSVNSSGSFKTFAEWQALGYDANSVIINPQLDSNYKLTSSSPSSVSAGGVNLSSIFTTDKDGNTRPSTGSWSMGAYQYSQSGAKTPQPPTNLRFK